VIAKFRDNDPRKRQNKWGKDVWEWEVEAMDENLHPIGDLILSRGSKRLRRALSQHKPLKGKILKMTASGSGMDTMYSVVEIPKLDPKALV